MKMKEKQKKISMKNTAKLSLFLMLFSFLFSPVINAANLSVDKNSAADFSDRNVVALQTASVPKQITFAVTEPSELSYNTNQSQIFNSVSLPVTKINLSSDCSVPDSLPSVSIQGTVLGANLNFDCRDSGVSSLLSQPLTVRVIHAQPIAVRHEQKANDSLEASKVMPLDGNAEQAIVQNNFSSASKETQVSDLAARISDVGANFSVNNFVTFFDLSFLQVYRC